MKLDVAEIPCTVPVTIILNVTVKRLISSVLIVNVRVAELKVTKSGKAPPLYYATYVIAPHYKGKS